MSYGITRDAAFELINQHLKNPNMIKHCLATEAVMRELAVHFDEDPEKWGIAGLLHDLDAESQPDPVWNRDRPSGSCILEAPGGKSLLPRGAGLVFAVGSLLVHAV